MNSRSANSGGFASPVPPPPPVEVFVVLPDGSCIPATPDKLKIVLRQARSNATKQARLKAQEKAVELQCNLEDRAAARRLVQELAEIDLERRRMAATLRGRVKAERPAPQTSNVIKRSPKLPPRRVIAMIPVPSSWVVDDFGMRGVHYNQSYIGRKSPGFYRGAARDRWSYEARDEAVLRDADGEPVIIANIGDDLDEIGAAWQAIEDATVRKNGKIQIRLIVALDADASDAEKVAALTHFCKTVLEPLGLPYSAVIHRAPQDGDQRNVHAHILTNFRPTERVGPYCWSFADHVRGELDGKNGVQMLRHLWAHSMSEAAEQAQRSMLYTGLGYGARGLDLETGEHLGEGLNAISRRGGKVWAEERNRIKQARNSARRVIRDADKKIAALTTLRDSLIAQAEAERAGKMPTRRLASMSSSQRPIAPGLQISSGVAAVRRPGVMTASRADDLRHEPLVASQLPMRAAIVRGATNMDARSAPIVASVAPMSVKPLNTSAEVVACPRLETAGRTCDASRLSTAVPPSSIPATLEPAIPAAAVVKMASRGEMLQADQLVPSSAAIASDPLVNRTREMLAAFARWRETQVQDVAIGRSVTSEKPEAAALPASEPDSGSPGVTERAITPSLVGGYRLRKSKPQRDHLFEPVETLPTREWLEDNPHTVFGEAAALQLKQDGQLIAWLRKKDAYVADFGSGWLELDPQMMVKLELDDDRLQRAHVQRELAMIRQEQQIVLAGLASEARQRPLSFSKAANRFWPNDLDPALLQRIDHWHARHGEALLRDLFPIEQDVREAHRRELAKAGGRSRGSPMAAGASGSAASPRNENEGRYRPVAEVPELARLRIPPFTHRRGPTIAMVRLLRYAAEKPDDIEIVSGEAPRVLARTPETIENLLHQWRGNERVMKAVADTIVRSRAAGRPDWPEEFANALRPPNKRPPAPKWKRHDTGRSR